MTQTQKTAEEELLEFAQSLRPSMTSQQVMAIWEQVEREHQIVDGKIAILKGIYLEVIRKGLDERAMNEATPPTGEHGYLR